MTNLDNLPGGTGDKVPLVGYGVPEFVEAGPLLWKPVPVTDYGILEAPDGGTLTEVVKAKLADGWQPLGAPFMSPDSYWYQAMVKRSLT